MSLKCQFFSTNFSSFITMLTLLTIWLALCPHLSQLHRFYAQLVLVLSKETFLRWKYVEYNKWIWKLQKVNFDSIYVTEIAQNIEGKRDFDLVHLIFNIMQTCLNPENNLFKVSVMKYQYHHYSWLMIGPELG